MPEYYAPQEWDGSLLAKTKYGLALGVRGKSRTYAWKGVPFAAPPVGELRWKAPREPKPWPGTLKASRFPKPSLQMFSVAGKTVTLGSEDCLYLNIWRPGTKEKNLPVYVYIHGGGYSVGATKYRSCHGHAVACAMNAVYVSIQYRLGPMGWFHHPALAEGQTPEDASGNYGNLDIIQALRWIKENISSFGGDSERVAVAGESAGAMSIYALLASPLAKGLFHAAILQSGIKKTSSLKRADAHSDHILKKLLIKDARTKGGAGSVPTASIMQNAEIREYFYAKPAKDILKVHDIWTSGILSFPTLIRDGAVLPIDGFDCLDNGTAASLVPLMIGCNKDEWKLFMATEKKVPVGDPMFEPLAKFCTMDMKCRGVDSVARGFASAGASAYAYRFDWGAVNKKGESVLPGKQGKRLGACHGLDITFFLGTGKPVIEAILGKLFTAKNRPGREKLVEALLAYQKNFLYTGNPNGAAGFGPLPQWPQWEGAPHSSKAIILDADYREPRISLLQEEITEKSILESAEKELREPIKSAVLAELEVYAGREKK
jgi:para-nitrobenzyl esterase